MHIYRYDSAPAGDDGKSKGKQPATPANTSPSHAFAIPRSRKARPQVSRSTFDDPSADILEHDARDGIGGSRTRSREPYRSNTWGSSSVDINTVSDDEEVGDRTGFVTEYNRLAKKYGIRPIVLGDFPAATKETSESLPHKKGRWISRVLRHGSSSLAQAEEGKTDQALRTRRSISDLALNLVHHQRKVGLEHEDLRSLVRLCGKSILFLPAEYAPGSLILPTCLRATGQYLIQHADTYGIFRVPGSIRVTSALYDYYCAGVDGEDIATTTRCPNLPSHLNCGVHDVASTFKRILAGLPGGILGSLSLFDALVGIHSQLHGYVERTRTKEGKLRARLIALAISTVNSQYQRELICAVFGLLCVVGRAAENAPREDESGRPLPTSELMGYSSLAIVFGPLLLGDLLDSYSMKLADPASGLIILPLTPIKSKKRRKPKTQKQDKPSMLTVNRVLVANDIAEMLLVHWRDIVRHMKELDHLHTKPATTSSKHGNRGGHLRHVSTEAFHLSGPPGWIAKEIPFRSRRRASSPLVASPTPSSRIGRSGSLDNLDTQHGSLPIKRRRPRMCGPAPLHGMSRRHSVNALSPTAEESPDDELSEDRRKTFQERSLTELSYEPGKLEQLNTVPPSEGPHLPRSSEPGSRASNSTVASNPQNIARRGDSNAVDRHTSSSTTATQATEPRRTSNGVRVSTPSSLGTTRKYSQNTEHSSINLEANRDVSATQNSTAGHTPLNYSRKSLDQPPPAARDLKNDPGHVQPESSHNAVQIFRDETNDKPQQVDLSRKAELSHGPVFGGRSLSEQMPSSSVEPTPSSHPPVVDLVEIMTEYKSTGEQGVSLENANSNSPPPADKSSTWSLRHFVGRKSPRFPLSEQEIPFKGGEEQSHGSTKKGNTAPRWRSLARNNPSTVTSKVRGKGVFRRSIAGSTGEGGKLPLDAVQGMSTLEWKRQPPNKSVGTKRERSPLSPEKRGVFERSSQPQAGTSMKITPSRGKYTSPAKVSLAAVGKSFSQRCTSKPVSGSVQAMITRFDSASQDSPGSRKFTLNGRSQSVTVTPQQERPRTPTKSTQPNTAQASRHLFEKTMAEALSEVNPVASDLRETADTATNLIAPASDHIPSHPARASIVRLSQGKHEGSMRTASGDTPSMLGKVSIRSGNHIAARREPQESPTKVPHRDLEVTTPRSLGTMVPHLEDPPVATHINLIRGPSRASTRSHATAQQTSNDHASLLERYSPRPGSSNSLLHQQIRSLQRQLEIRSDEVQQLRRQLDTIGDVDVGTISEQLRQARRECKMWRERAEAAERRLVVFEKFSAKFKELREGARGIAGDEQLGANPSSPIGRAKRDKGMMDSSSSCSNHTENADVFKDRIRSSIKQSGRTGGDGVESPEGDAISPHGQHAPGQRMQRRDMAELTAQLWTAAQELASDEEVMEEGPSWAI